MLVVAAGLFLHAWPGFHNPVVISDAVLGLESQPYTKYLNFDKGLAALFLLGIYAPDRTATDDGVRQTHAFVWRFAVLVAGVLALTLAAGYVRWDPKLPAWWALWLWSMVFLTALPEETLFEASRDGPRTRVWCLRVGEARGHRDRRRAVWNRTRHGRSGVRRTGRRGRRRLRLDLLVDTVDRSRNPGPRRSEHGSLPVLQLSGADGTGCGLSAGLVS